MVDIKFILPPIEELTYLLAGCCCEIVVPGHGYVWGPKLIIKQEEVTLPNLA